MKTVVRVVNNRVFLLGLDELYREAMKRHERDELLRCARATAAALSVTPADVPIEGYYSEDEQLKEYFRLVRALQMVSKDREVEVASTSEYQRLKEVTESPIFGIPRRDRFLFAVARDPLSAALDQSSPQWNVENLVNLAYECASNSDDCSLVALASLSRDAVVLASLRESVVLYAEMVALCAPVFTPEYEWKVDAVVEERAQRFVETFNELFDESLPSPIPEQAHVFWNAYSDSEVIGRCVRIGFDDSARPTKYYHWAVDAGPDGNLVVNEFWDTEIWTTKRYRKRATGGGSIRTGKAQNAE